MPNTTGFCVIPMVRFDYNFPDVDEPTRRKLLDILLNIKLPTYRGGGGGPNSGVVYVPADQVDKLRRKLTEAGLPEVQPDEMYDKGAYY